MFAIVFSEKDKIKMLENGATFVKEQNMNGKTTYLFKNNTNINFEKSGITYLKTNDVNL